MNWFIIGTILTIVVFVVSVGVLYFNDSKRPDESHHAKTLKKFRILKSILLSTAITLIVLLLYLSLQMYICSKTTEVVLKNLGPEFTQ